MLERLCKYLLYINLKKYKFNITNIKFLKDIQINLKKIKTIKRKFKSKTYCKL